MVPIEKYTKTPDDFEGASQFVWLRVLKCLHWKWRPLVTCTSSMVQIVGEIVEKSWNCVHRVFQNEALHQFHVQSVHIVLATVHPLRVHFAWWVSESMFLRWILYGFAKNPVV